MPSRVYHHFKFFVKFGQLLVQLGHLLRLDRLCWVDDEILRGVLIFDRINIENLPPSHSLLHGKSLNSLSSKLPTATND